MGFGASKDAEPIQEMPAPFNWDEHVSVCTQCARSYSNAKMTLEEEEKWHVVETHRNIMSGDGASLLFNGQFEGFVDSSFICDLLRDLQKDKCDHYLSALLRLLLNSPAAKKRAFNAALSVMLPQITDLRLAQFYRDLFRNYTREYESVCQCKMWETFDKDISACASKLTYPRAICPADLVLWQLVYQFPVASEEYIGLFDDLATPGVYRTRSMKYYRVIPRAITTMVRAFASDVCMLQFANQRPLTFIGVLPVDLIRMLARYIDRMHFETCQGATLCVQTRHDFDFKLGRIHKPPALWDPCFAAIQVRRFSICGSISYEPGY
jgi:hypothetical protein